MTLFIFDVGNVLLRHDNALLAERLAARCADPAAAYPVLLASPGDVGLETGRTSMADLHGRLVRDLGFQADYDEFLVLWNCHFSDEPGMDAVIEDLAGRYRVVLLSNSNDGHWQHVSAAYPLLAHAHAIYLSHEMGLAKPDPAIYARVLEIENVLAENAVFIDDKAENTAAAAALGLDTVTFRGKAAFTDWLRQGKYVD